MTWTAKIAVAALLTAIAFAAGASLAQADEGTVDGQFGWLGVGQTYTLADNHVFWTGEFSGTFFSDTGEGPVHRVSMACPASNDIIDGKSNAAGYCVMTDADGDKAYMKWTCSGDLPECPGESAWLAGTGKFEGIEGNWTFTGMFGQPTEAGTMGYALIHGMPYQTK